VSTRWIVPLPMWTSTTALVRMCSGSARIGGTTGGWIVKPMTSESDPFPWEALYRALAGRIIELSAQYPVSSSRLQPEIAALALVHGEVLERRDADV